MTDGRLKTLQVVHNQLKNVLVVVNYDIVVNSITTQRPNMVAEEGFVQSLTIYHAGIN